MKGLYQLKADHNITQKFIDAGGDTLIIPFYEIPGRASTGLLNTWEENIETCMKFKDKIKIIANPIAMPHWCSDVQEDRRFVYQGNKLDKTFCPTNAEHYDYLISPFRDLIGRGIIDEVVWDNEQYPEYEHDGKKTNEPKYFSKKIACECNHDIGNGRTCASLGQEGQWKHRQLFTQKDKFVTGQLAIDSWWSVNCLSEKRILPEGTYEQKSDFGKKLMRLQLWSVRAIARLFHNCKMTMVPGAWIEVWKSTNDFIKYLEYLSKHYNKLGYWIYSQSSLAGIEMSQTDIENNIKSYGFCDPRKIDERDPTFFDKLKAFNN